MPDSSSGAIQQSTQMTTPEATPPSTEEQPTPEPTPPSTEPAAPSGEEPSTAEPTPPSTEEQPTPETAPPSAEQQPAPSHPAQRQLDLLAAIPVQPRVSEGKYNREEAFGKAWEDKVDLPYGRNGCRTREDILARDLENVTYVPSGKRNCRVQSGTLHDPYTGRTIEFIRGHKDVTTHGVDIDHVVALGDAWDKGAQNLTLQRRIELANDPLNLLAVDPSANRGKGRKDASGYLPRAQFRCAYAQIQVEVKHKYNLSVTRAEHAALQRELERCTPETARQPEMLYLTS